MLNISNTLRLSLASFFVFSYIGCGGGSGSSSNPVSTTISGIVYDPEISGADVSLVCKDKTYYASSLTKSDGRFTITIEDKNVNALSSCVLHSSKGLDGGNNFEDTTLKSPLSIFNTYDDVVITPITTVVASYEGVENNASTALQKAAKYFNTTQEKIKQTPQGDLQKISSLLSAYALTDTSSGEKKGFDIIDLDDTQEEFNITNILNNDTTISNKEALADNLKDIIASDGSKDEILSISVKHRAKALLLKAYDINDTDTNYTHFIHNINAFSLKITNALKKDDNTYVYPNRYVIRKALSDANLTISRDENNTLTKSAYEGISSNDIDFTNVTLDIQDIKGIKLYDVNTYKKTLGDDNDKRVEYYTFSNISNIGEALEIAKTSYDDNVLDPIYAKVATGYIKLGFYDEAVAVANENIYSDSTKIEALVNIGTALTDLNQTTLAKEALDSAFTAFKKYAKAIGKENLSDGDYTLLVNMLVGYNNIKENAKKEAVVSYIDEILKIAKPRTFNTLLASIKELVGEAILAQDKADVTYLVNLGYKFAIQVPLEKQDGTYNYVYRTLTYILPYTTYVGEASKGDVLIERGKQADATEFQEDYKGDILAHEILKSKDKMNEVVKNFDSYLGTSYYSKYSTVSDILENGLATALVLDGKTSKAIELITKYYRGGHDPVKTRPDVFKFFISSDRIETANILGFIDKEKQEEFILALFNDSKTNFNTDKNVTTKDAWTFVRSGSKYKDKNKDMVVALFEGYSGMLGYPTMIEYLAKNGSYDKIKDILTFAINDVVDTKITSAVYKTQATISILTALENAKYFQNASGVSDLQTSLNEKVKNLASQITFDTTAKSYPLDVDWSILISNYLSSNGDLVAAREILEKINASLVQPDTSDFDEVVKYIKRQIGSLNTLNGMDTADERLLGGYISAKELDKAEALIDRVKKLLDTQDSSLDKDEPLLLVARAYAMINKKEKALQAIDEIKTIKAKNNAKLFTTQYLADFDSFPSTDVASIDTDQDGKPDFFSKFATQEQIATSGLKLDDDIDGDGILDTVDTLPYHKN